MEWLRWSCICRCTYEGREHQENTVRVTICTSRPSEVQVQMQLYYITRSLLPFLMTFSDNTSRLAQGS
jgi:hypothetical protein